MNLRTGLEPESANTHGNAEVPDNVKDKDGAMEMMLAKKSTNEYYLSLYKIKPPTLVLRWIELLG